MFDRHDDSMMINLIFTKLNSYAHRGRGALASRVPRVTKHHDSGLDTTDFFSLCPPLAYPIPPRGVGGGPGFKVLKAKSKVLKGKNVEMQNN